MNRSQESKSLGFNNEVEAVSTLDEFKKSVALPGKSNEKLQFVSKVEILRVLLKLETFLFRCLCISFQIIIKPTMRRNFSIHQHFMSSVSISTFLYGKNKNTFQICFLNHIFF